MRKILFAVAGSLALACMIPASAKQWVDYAPQKGFWQYTYVKVDVNCPRQCKINPVRQFSIDPGMKPGA